MPEDVPFTSCSPEDETTLDILAARIGALEILVQNLMVTEFMKDREPLDRATTAIQRARRQLHSVQARDGDAGLPEIRATQACFIEMLEVVRETVQQLEGRNNDSQG